MCDFVWFVFHFRFNLFVARWTDDFRWFWTNWRRILEVIHLIMFKWLGILGWIVRRCFWAGWWIAGWWIAGWWIIIVLRRNLTVWAVCWYTRIHRISNDTLSARQFYDFHLKLCNLTDLNEKYCQSNLIGLLRFKKEKKTLRFGFKV